MSIANDYSPEINLIAEDQLIICDIKPSVHVGFLQADLIYQFAREHFDDDFGLIQIRNGNNSVDPDLYFRLQKNLPGLRACAVIANSLTVKEFFAAEQLFIDELGIQCKVFGNYPEAEIWVKTIINDYSDLPITTYRAN